MGSEMCIRDRVVVTARRSAFLQGDQPKLVALAQETTKPVFLWSYTTPSDKSVEVVSEAGFPLFKTPDGCARVMRMLNHYRETRERLLKPAEPISKMKPDRAAARALLLAAPPAMP